MLDQIEQYRRTAILTDGKRVLLRPLFPGDRDALVELFAWLPEEDLKFFHANVRDRELVAGWAENLDYRKVLPLVATADDRLVGDTSLHLREGPERHVALVRIFIAREFRRRGLGVAMLCSLIDLARQTGLQQLIAEIPSAHVKPIAAFKGLGFEHRGTLPDYFMAADGETHDIDVLGLRLTPRQDEF